MIKIDASAKINLFLNIKNKRTDGYHEIESVMQEISLQDEIILESNNSGMIEISGIEDCEETDIPWDERNLAYKAAKIFINTLGINKGLTIKIKKNIPSSAGLGGGSSDAAATLIGVNRLWNTNLPEDKLAKIGEKIGSDVPFFLYGRTALVTGKGENVLLLPTLPKVWLVLVKPPLAVSTKWAYDCFDSEHCCTASTNNKKILELIQQGNKDRLWDLLYNDLEEVVFKHHPILKEIRNLLMSFGAKKALMAGSGSTVFGIFDTQEQSNDVFEKISKYNFGKVYICNSIN